ncbi:MAG: hypothetical protein WBF39_05770, partial [Planococcus donghaensis]
ENGTTELHVGKLDYLKEPFEKALENGVIDPHEKLAVKFAFDALQLEQPEILKEKEVVNTKQQNQNKVREFEMER